MDFSDSECSDSDLEFELYSQIHYNYDTSKKQSSTPKCDNKICVDKQEYSDNPKNSNLLNWLTVLKDTPSTVSFKTPERKGKCKEKDDDDTMQNWEVVTHRPDAESSPNQSTLNINQKKSSNTEWKTPEDDIVSNLFDKKRYYSPKTVARCKNCDMSGHLAVACPKPKKQMPCYLCAKTGHYAKLCKEFKSYSSKAQARAECKRCGQLGHKKSKCPDIWRQYHLTVRPGKLVTSVKPGRHAKHSYCFNCSKKGHFGHHCNKARFKPYFEAVSCRITKYDKSQQVEKQSSPPLKRRKLKRKGLNGFHCKAKMPCM